MPEPLPEPFEPLPELLLPLPSDVPLPPHAASDSATSPTAIEARFLMFLT